MEAARSHEQKFLLGLGQLIIKLIDGSHLNSLVKVTSLQSIGNQ